VVFDVIVVGGGAAGLFCARTAGLRGRRVLVLESNARPGNKILISGGGRCNFTNAGATAANYFTSGSPDFMKSALARFRPDDFVALVEQAGIAWKEKKLGQLFCQQSSRQILQFLEHECIHLGVEIRTRCLTTAVSRRGVDHRTAFRSGHAPPAGEWELATTGGTVRSRSLVIAAGGLSFPNLGATPFGYSIARQFGVPLIPTRPGLVPLTWAPRDRDYFQELSGVSIDCEVSAGSHPQRFRENLLFTHRGLSGPAILQISNVWRPGERLVVNLLPDLNALDVLLQHRGEGRGVQAALKRLLPERFLEKWCARNVANRPMAQLTRETLQDVARRLHAWEVTPAGDEGYSKAEVTLGGVDTGALSSRTMECRNIAGLFFIGEVVDVTGWLGGYNFQWAWSSAHAAGCAV
jgi:predicted Rossmann fold flavoprotein